MDGTSRDQPDTLLIGLGNPILGDDGVGFCVVEALQPYLDPERVSVLLASVGGFRLMETLADYRRAILVDAVQLGGEAGQIYRFTPEQFRGSVRAASPHDAGLPEALALGNRLGMEMPDEVIVLGIEAAQVTEFTETLSPPVEAAIPHTAAAVVELLEPDLLAAIQDQLREERLPCAAVFEIARSNNMAPRRVAGLADAVGHRVGWCQLGLFGGEKHEEQQKEREEPQAAQIPPALRAELERRAEGETLSCAQAWGVAKRLEIDRHTVGRAANALQIQIIDCQLGFF